MLFKLLMVKRSPISWITRKAALIALFLPLTPAYAQRMTTFSFVAPAGGESYAAGSTVQIRWSSVNPIGNVDVELFKAGQEVAGVAYVPMESNQAPWEICPVLPNGADYTLRLSGQDANGNPVELTSAPFSITSSLPQPSFSVTSPAAGASVAAGGTQTIQWTFSNAAGQIYIDLVQNGNVVQNIGYAAVSDGQFIWRSCDALPAASDYAVRLSMDGCGTGLTSTSNPFTITAGPPLQVSLLSPSGGQELTAGVPQTITWSSNDSSALITLDLLKNDQWHAHIGTVQSSLGSFSYTICPDIGDGTDYRVRIQASDSCGQVAMSMSDLLTITGSSSRPGVTILGPQGQEVWVQGTTQNITWQQDSSDKAVVGLVKGGLWRSTLGYVAAPGGLFAWNIPPELPDSRDYQIALRLPHCRTVISDTTPPFSLRLGPAMLQSDADGDGDVDIDDFGHFQLCYTGPNASQPQAACRRFDLDDDGDVDGNDLGLLAACTLGSGVPQANTNCDMP